MSTADIVTYYSLLFPKDERRKLDFKSRRCILLGYTNNQKGYRLYDTERRKIIHSCDIQFNELEFGVEHLSHQLNQHY